MGQYLSYRDGGKTNEQGLFEWLKKLFTPGVPYIDSTTSMQLVQRGAGANMSVDISIGDVSLPAANYSYWGFTDAVVNQVIAASDPSNPRIDVIVAYADLTVVDSTNNNNPGALKFKAIAGTPAGSPAAPNSTAIQSSVGAGNPWAYLGSVLVGTSVTTIINANITDLRQPMAVKARIWGGSSSTYGHVVPNIPDDTLMTESGVEGMRNKTVYGDNTIYASGLYNPYKFSAYRNAGSLTISSSVDTQITFDTEEYDTNSNFVSSTFTAPIAGFYVFSTSIGYTAQASNTRLFAMFYKNSSEIKRGDDRSTNALSGSAIVSSPPIQLAANDTIKVYARAVGGSGSAVTNGQTVSYFSGYLMSAT